jgi:hypothetical protein
MTAAGEVKRDLPALVDRHDAAGEHTRALVLRVARQHQHAHTGVVVIDYRALCRLPDQLIPRRPDDAVAGAVQEVARIVQQVRQHWPEVKIVLRGDSGFCREELMAWCECNRVGYAFGLARNQRLREQIDQQIQQAYALHQSTGEAARVFSGFAYRTLKSWSRSRRVVAKAEVLDKGENPRFVVTSLDPGTWPDQALYE